MTYEDVTPSAPSAPSQDDPQDRPFGRRSHLLQKNLDMWAMLP